MTGKKKALIIAIEVLIKLNKSYKCLLYQKVVQCVESFNILHLKLRVLQSALQEESMKD